MMARPFIPLEQRFWSHVRFGFGCWAWTAAKQSNGYGVIGLGGRRGGNRVAHRVAYELLVGPIPEGLHLDHLCRNRGCVNPAHLEAVTQAENNRRNRLDHACRRGHLRTAENTYIEPDGSRQCRDCRAVRRAA